MNPFDPFPTLETSRLRMRAPTMDDDAEMFRVSADPRVARYVGKPPPASIEVVQEKMRKVLANIARGEAILWVLTDRERGAYLGSVVLWSWDKPNFRAELGYDLDPAWWGRGLVPEAIVPALRFGFERMALHSVEARIHPDNHASRRVLEKLGFQKEAHFRENHWNEGVFEDTAVYSLLRPR